MFPKNTVSAAIIAATFASVGCSSSGGGSNIPAAPITLSGTAAAGAPIIGQVTVKGAMGLTKSALIEADGSYDVDVSGLTAPYRLRAQGSVGGRTYKLHSYAEAADVGETINITPFTDLIIANAAQQLASSFFESTTTTELSAEDVETQETALQAKLQNVFDALGLGAAIDLLKDSFSADHSGLDAALDIINISVDEGTHVATITNLVENSYITDDILDADDNNDTVEVSNPTALSTAVTDTQAIASLFTSLSSAFASSLPTEAAIEAYFTDDFLSWDQGKSQFLTEFTTDPNLVGFMFSGVSVEIISDTTAAATFNFGASGNIFADEIATWYAVKTGASWQLRGDQRIADVSASYQCTDNDSAQVKKCSFHVNIEDTDFTNNPGSVAIVSATATVVDGALGHDKAIVFLDTPAVQQGGEAGYLQIYNNSNYSGDYQPFGTGAGEIDPTASATTFLAGDTVRIELYESALDKTDTANPFVVGSPVATYTQRLPFAPDLDAATAPYPTATQATLNATQAYTLGNNLTVSWNLAAGTRNDEIALLIWDSNGAGAEVWIDTFATTATSTTISGAELSTEAALLDQNATSYNTELRIYAEDPLTGQSYLTQYFGTIDGPAATGGGGSPLTCNYESGWDDNSNQPATFNSYTDFETVVADCGAQAITNAQVVGVWSDTWTDIDGDWDDSFEFNANGTGTYTETLNGNILDTEAFEWSLANNQVTITIPGQFLEIWAFTSNSEQKAYSEATDWTSPSDLTPDGTADGEIWTGYFVKQ